MTKLVEWISVASAVFAIWYSFVAGYVKHPIIVKHMNLIMLSPLIFVFIFAFYALFVVLYRVFTFNDCHEAAKELQQEIVDARKDLSTKGFEFHTMS